MKYTACVLLLGTVCAAQESGRKAPPVDSARVEGAIKKGIAFLKTADSPRIPGQPHFPEFANSDALILLTLLHAGVPDSDPRFRELFMRMMEFPLERTYSVALQAMVLEELDRVQYQGRIAQCAQFLVDNQCKNGQWGYGQPSPFVKGTPTQAAKRDVATAPKPAGQDQVKPNVTRKIYIRKHRDGGATGDNSNTQYAILGLRACHEAGVSVSSEVTGPAMRWWRKTQVMDREQGKTADVATGGGIREVGHWIYAESEPGRVYSMTAGGVGSLCILNKIHGADWKKDRSVRAGMNWLADHFSVTPKDGDVQKLMHFYYLYALERAGILYGTETLGEHAWYAEGAGFLLGAQRPDGSWGGGENIWAWWSPVWDSCFAVLFLKRATRSLDVATEDRFHLKNR